MHFADQGHPLLLGILSDVKHCALTLSFVPFSQHVNNVPLKRVIFMAQTLHETTHMSVLFGHWII